MISSALFFILLYHYQFLRFVIHLSLSPLVSPLLLMTLKSPPLAQITMTLDYMCCFVLLQFQNKTKKGGLIKKGNIKTINDEEVKDISLTQEFSPGIGTQ